MNKIFSSLLALLLAASLLTGCGAASSTAASSAASSEAAVSSAVSEAASSEAASEAAASSAVSEAAAEAGADLVEAAFTVVYADGTSEELTLSVQPGTLLSDALRDAGVISAEEAEAGFVTTVNGVTADWDADGAWWCLTDANGEMTTVGIADIALQAGDSYAFTYTTN